jgi:exodeoxyribonuclease V beta subunit
MKDSAVKAKGGNVQVSQGAAAAEGYPDSIAALDLSKPGLLEASAGTGKTYAIEFLVLRLLLETPGLELPRILVLTFTEKAAGELKEKIRARIAWCIAKGGLPEPVLARLKRAHLEFDRASIHTIHGFCQRVLKKYAFENNALFRQELQKNLREALEQVLHEEMRSTWLAEAGPGPEGMEAFRRKAAALGLGSRSKWKQPLIDIAKGFNPLRGDALLPDCDPERIAAWRAEMAEAFAEVTRLAPGTAAGSGAEHPFAARFAAIKFASPATRKKGPLIIAAALRAAALCAGLPDTGSKAEAIRDFIAQAEDGPIGLMGVRKEGFRFLAPAEGEDGSGPWPELPVFLGLLDKARAAAARIDRELAALAYAPKRDAILRLRERTRARLHEQGIITFDSMIEDLCLALRQKAERVEMLRQEYRYCLVDEFQDTDPLQWEIFRRLFLDSGSANPLYLIGDPKQAIYRFRGGDVYTYMEARKRLFELSREGLAQGIGLDTNYRSSGAMVEAYNAAFTHRGWFHAHPVDPTDTAWRLPAEPDPLGYVPVKYGSLPVQRAEDSTAAPKPIILKDFSRGAPDGTALKKRVNHWIVSEIAALMAAPERLLIPDKETGIRRPVSWGDICILIRKRKEKTRLERILAEAGIPVQVSGRAGLYQSDAAGQYLAVLESLEDPADAGKHARALLTRFFRCEGDPPPAGPPEAPHPLFADWLLLAERRRWQRLFHALQYRTGLLYRESLGEDADRRIMDFIHIGQNLVQEAARENLDLAGLVQRLRDLRAMEPGGDEEGEMHREESEGGKVVLMTMHVSKGLEFPVVFLAGFSGNPNPNHLKYREGLRTVYNLDTKDPDGKRAFQEESEGEDRRLYYVALTRARYKLYVPLLPPTLGRTDTGPLGGFAAEALRTAASLRPELYHLAPDEDYAKPLPPLPHPDARSGPHAKSTVPAAAPDADFLEDYPREGGLSGSDADFSRRRRRLASYSHLVRYGHGLAAEDVEGRFDKEEAPASSEISPTAEGTERTAADIPGNALPRGKDIGNMFHELLERIDFSAAAKAVSSDALLEDAAVRDLIGECMQDHRLDASWRAGVADVIWNVLRMRIPDPAGGAPFTLAEVAQRRPEMEFLFPYPARAGSAGPDGYMWGFIDLVFRHRGRYYLLDWKSNHLERYDRRSLDRSMAESSYDLQYMLYSLALDRWLGSLVPDYDFATHFGGIYYAYLRGMRAEGGDAGIFALKPTREQMREEYPAHLAKRMSASAGSRIDAAALLAGEGGLP